MPYIIAFVLLLFGLPVMASAANSLPATPPQPPGNLTADGYFQLYEQRTAQGNSQAALAAIDKAVSLAPGKIDYWWARAEAANALNALPQLEDSYEHILQMRPNDLDILYRLALVQSWQPNDYPEAEKSFQRYLQLSPNHATAWIGYANLKSWEGNYPQALQILETYRKRFGETQEYLTAKANVLALAKQSQPPPPPSPSLPPLLAAASPPPPLLQLPPPPPLKPASFAAKKPQKKVTPLKPATTEKPQPAPVILQPGTVAYWQDKGQRANAAGNAVEMADSYAHVLQLDPNDQEAMHQLALAESWQPKKMGQAAKDFQRYLKRYPNDDAAWLQYANLASWRSDPHVFKILEEYRKRFGETNAYLATKARILSANGRYQSALAINTPLLNADPQNPDLLYTQVHALKQTSRKKEATAMLSQLQNIHPQDPDVLDLKRAMDDALRASVEMGADIFRGSDGVHIVQAPILATIPVNFSTAVLIKGVYERLHADTNSGSETIDGKQNIAQQSVLTGLTHQWNDVVDSKALIGGLHVDGHGDRLIYNLGAGFTLNETTKLTLSHTHDSYRPYLFSTSPKAISLAILENDSTAILSWEPVWQRNINFLADYGTLSDGNSYWRLNMSPTAKVIGSQYVDLTLGLDADLLHFAQQLQNGYYDPDFHQEYLVTAAMNVKQNDKIAYYLSAAAGPQRDQNTQGFHLAYNAFGGFTWTITSHYSLSTGIEYDYSGSGNTPYHSLAVTSLLGAIL